MTRPDTNTVEDDLDKEIAEMLVAVISHGFNSGTFRTESILAAIRANYDITIKEEVMTQPETIALCELCGEPLPAGEQMFKYHGYSGNCPRSPLPKPKLDAVVEYYKLDDVDGEWWISVHVNRKPHEKIGFPSAGERDRALADLLNMQRSHGAIDVTEQ